MKNNPIKTIPGIPVYTDAVNKELMQDEVQFMKDKFPIVSLTRIEDGKFLAIMPDMCTATVQSIYNTIGNIANSTRVDKNHMEKIYNIDTKSP
ncbi:hypothetical protein HOL24_01450 [bacterium]|nr:hypothetical protein [bacterium]